MKTSALSGLYTLPSKAGNAACRGCVTCVKLSPNLRRVSQGDGKQTAKELEVAKLEKVIEVALKGMSEAI